MKYIVSDLDGTLLNKDHMWDEKIEEVMEKVVQSNVEFVVATGRSLSGVRELKWLWDAPIYIIAMNGSIILNKERVVIYSSTLKENDIRNIFTTFNKIGLEFFTEEEIITNFSKRDYINKYSKWDMWIKRVLNNPNEEFLTEYLERIRFDAIYEDLLEENIFKVNGLYIKDEEIELVRRGLENLPISILNAPFSDSVFELTNADASKNQALNYLIDLFKWEKNQIYVFGDGGNDRSMLESNINSYAPDSAPAEIKSIVSKVVSSVEKYGVIKEIESIIKDD